MDRDSLARRLGTTAHLSPLLHKARRAGLDDSGLALLAVRRGCDYYDGGRFADSRELAVALLHPGLAYNPHSLRLGAAMLGADFSPLTPRHVELAAD
jgi:hypothetical protein